MKINTFGDFLYDYRKKHKLSLENLREITGVSQPYLSQLERGSKTPSRQIVERIAKGIAVNNDKNFNDTHKKLLKMAGYSEIKYADSFYDLMSSEEIEEVMYERDFYNSIEEYKELEYPDIKHFLSKSEVYHNKKRLDNETKILASKILDVLTEDLEVNYPSQERIEKEYDKKIKTLEILKKRIKRKNNKEGE